MKDAASVIAAIHYLKYRIWRSRDAGICPLRHAHAVSYEGRGRCVRKTPGLPEKDAF